MSNLVLKLNLLGWKKNHPVKCWINKESKMDKVIKILMAELKQQHEWRLEDSECGDCEVAESWDRTKYRIAQDLRKISCAEEVVDKVLNF